MRKAGVTFRGRFLAGLAFWAASAGAFSVASAATVTGLTAQSCPPTCETITPDGLAPVSLTLPYLAPDYMVAPPDMPGGLPPDGRELPLFLLAPLPDLSAPPKPAVQLPDPPAIQ